MTEYGMKADVFKELIEKFISDAEAMSDVSDYYRGKADAFQTVLFALNS